ncbi:MAG TPA: Flp family type IVb pilin [Gaiellaceae bacterium]|nr:Flp family type IVb pilin [Gaiellaceae bacterium]
MTTLNARSTNRPTRHFRVSPMRAIRSTFSAPACVPGAGKGGESTMFKSLVSLSRREDGQTMAEYGVVLAVITLAIVATLGLLSGAINSALNSVIDVL